MSLALEKTLIPAIGQPLQPRPDESEQKLNIVVVFTSVEATLTALKAAGEMANSLGARITLLVPQIVPYPVPLQSPPVLIDFNERCFRVIANESPVETTVNIYLCRDRFEALSAVLKPHSLIVLGARKRLWPTSDKNLARKLRKAGHEVILRETE